MLTSAISEDQGICTFYIKRFRNTQSGYVITYVIKKANLKEKKKLSPNIIMSSHTILTSHRHEGLISQQPPGPKKRHSLPIIPSENLPASLSNK